MTRQRALIYNIVTAEPKHRTAEEIYALARQQMPSLARGTVYRNLGILVQEGLLSKLDMADAPAIYDRDSRSHPHLVCRGCGKVEDLIMPEGMLAPLVDTYGLTLTGFDLKLYHICPACRGEKEIMHNERSIGELEKPAVRSEV